MEKKLPKIFVNKIDKELNNNAKVYYSKVIDKKEEIKNDEIKNDEIEMELWPDLTNKTVEEKIDEIFNSHNYIYKANVDIKLKSGTVSKKVIGRSTTHIVTLDDELIPISDVLDINYTK